jgi:uncharacterized protein YndB with AHSA1/START domain
MEQKTKINAEEGKQDIVVTREFDLPVELLFKAHTEPTLLEQWMGLTVLKLEIKNHGSFEFETIRDGKVVFTANGTIHQVTPDKTIIRTFEMNNLLAGVRLEFLEFESITTDTSKLTMQMIYQSEQHRAEQLKLPFANGLNMAHNRLQELLTIKK